MNVIDTYTLVAQWGPSLTLGPLCSNMSMGPPGTATLTLSASKSLPTSKFPVWSSRAKAGKEHGIMEALNLELTISIQISDYYAKIESTNQ